MNSTHRVVIVLVGAALVLLFISLEQHTPDSCRALPLSGTPPGGTYELVALAALLMTASAMRTLFS